MGSGRAIMQPLHTFCAEPLDPFGDGLRRRVELVVRVGLAQPTLDHASHHRLSTFGRQRRILVDVHLVSPWNTEASQPQLPRFRPDGQPPERPHLGSVKEVSLKEARLARDAARLRVKGDRSTPGVDIVQERRAAREEAKAVEIKITLPTFEQCAEVYIRERWSTWSKKHRNQWPSSLKRYAYPMIGNLNVLEIKPSHVYELLRPIWVEKRETANRVRGRIETIIAKNVDVDDTDFRNPAELTKQLREKLPRRPKRVVRHHPALPYAEAPQFMADLSAATGTAASMLYFLIFTACRTNEAVDARWSEIDRPSSTWKIPGERMKMHQDHVVPLFEPALAILDKIRDKSEGELIFPNPDA